jgi:hypothetical protein
MSHKPGYPCDAAAGSVTFSAKTGAAIIPAARIEKPVTSFLVACILYQYRWRLEAWLHWFHRKFCDLVTPLLPSIQIFESTIFGLSLCSWAMSADTFYSAEAANSSQCIFASALRNWR